jgi:hypothetical protein
MMKNISLLTAFCILFQFANTLLAQSGDHSERMFNDPNTSPRIYIPEQQRTSYEKFLKQSLPGPSAVQLNKTSEIEPETTVYHLSEEPSLADSCGSRFYPQPLIFDDGTSFYNNGTGGPITLTTTRGGQQESFPVYMAEHGIVFNLRPRLGRVAPELLEAYVYFSQGTAKVFDADQFKFKVRRLQQSGATMLFEQNFSLDDEGRAGKTWTDVLAEPTPLFDPSNLIRMSDTIALGSGNYLLSVDVKTQTSDDTITVFFYGRLQNCFSDEFTIEERQTAWRVYMVNAPEFTPYGMGSWNFLFNGQPDSIRNGETGLQRYSVGPAIVPILGYYPASVDDDGILADMGNLGLAPIYPNPARDIANIAFELKRPDDVEITVSDINGRLVYDSGVQRYGAGRSYLPINLDSFSCGTYTVAVQTATGRLGTKLVVDK